MPKKSIQLSDRFTYSRLLRFVLPSAPCCSFHLRHRGRPVCFQLWGKTALQRSTSSCRCRSCWALSALCWAPAGSAIVGITLGEGDQKKADRYFTMFMWAALISVSVLAVLEHPAPAAGRRAAGRKGELLDYAVCYGRILMLALPPRRCKNMFKSFFVTAEKPLLGFWFTVGAGYTNMVLDVVMVGMLLGRGGPLPRHPHQPIGGRRAAGVPLSTTAIPAACTCAEHSLRPRAVGCLHQQLFELMTNLSMSLVNILYNFQLRGLPEKRRGGLRRHHVRCLPVCGGVRGLCGGQRTHRPLPLRRATTPVHNLYKRSAPHRRGGCDHDGSVYGHHSYVARIFGQATMPQLLALTNRAFRLYA